MATTLSLTTRRSSAMANLAASKAPSAVAEGPKGKLQNSGHIDDAARRKASSTAINGKVRDNEAQQMPDAGAESDIDELVDSDTEKAVESTKSTRTSTRARPARSTSGATTKKASSPAAAAQPVQSKDAVPSSNEEIKPSAPSPQEDKTTKPAPPTSREMLGRTATGGALPYYYAQPQVTPSRTAASPRMGSGGKKLGSGGASMQASSKNGSLKGEAGSAPSSESDDLTPQEVDKFMDLIEKYNLDGSNEDEMARSVTELYQEWLEWCAKRNVQSTKSKQALVSEFVRIHHGAYGVARQQRAVGIVQGSRSFDHAGMTHAARQTSSNGHGSRTAASHRTDTSQQKTRASEVATNAARIARSPAVVSRSITPAPAATYDGSYVKEIPAVVLEDMHRQIRDEIWKEVAIVINQMVHDQVSDIVADNRAMSARIEQLETHSDNLAQWVQHLNRVQEDTARVAQHETSVPPAAAEMRQPPAEYAHHAMSYPSSAQAHPNYVPRGYPSAYSSSGASPKHGYAMPVRTSPSPPLSNRSHGPSSRAQQLPPTKDLYDRQGGAAHTYGGGAPAPSPASHPHHGYHAPHHESPHMMSGRAAVPSPAGAGGGAAYYDDAGRLPPSEYGASGRAYYPQARDDRMLPPHPASPGAAGDMRQVKRARNGF